MGPIPCIDCLCFPICKNKSYIRFFLNCKIIWDYKREVHTESTKWESTKFRHYSLEEFHTYLMYLIKTKKVVEIF